MPKPMAIVGAGPLTSMIWKDGDRHSGWRYRFNAFRSAAGGRVSQLFRPADVIHFVKLAQVLAAVISDDGCLSQTERGVLKQLADDLDQLRQKVSNRTGTSRRGAADPEASHHMKDGSNGDATRS
jgi:hypothetical protein